MCVALRALITFFIGFVQPSTGYRTENSVQTSTSPEPVLPGVCRNSSNAWIHRRLGNYSDMLAARCDEPSLLLVQRDVMRIKQLEQAYSQEKFDELFPEEWTLKSRNLKIILALTTIGANGLNYGLGGTIGLIDTWLGNGVAPVFSYGMSWDAHIKESNNNLTNFGAPTPTDVWEDTPFGLLNDVFRSIDKASRISADSQPCIVEST